MVESTGTNGEYTIERGMTKQRSIIALLTDFGNRDSYVAAVKGVIASRCDAAIVDLSHDIPPYDIFAAGYYLRTILPYWTTGDDGPRRVIFVAVIDPGVGTERRILAAESAGRFIVAPDNGLLSVALPDDASIVSLEQETFFLPSGSRTFHGRDRFAPVAAAIANGTLLGAFGPAVDREAIVALDWRPPVYEDAEAKGSIVSIDRFGNIVTDLEIGRLGDLDGWIATIGGMSIRNTARSYAEGKVFDGPFLIEGSNGTVEVSLSRENAADGLRVAKLEPVLMWKKQLKR